MGNACIFSMSDPQRARRVDDEEEASAGAARPHRRSSHGSLGLRRRRARGGGKRLISARRAEGLAMDSPVWQRGILMGGRCEPPNFSGVILYDEKGNYVPQLPCRSPKDPPLRLVS